ncbi:MAG: hypothetical protein DWH91_10310 [Planctomycetota bacterium]|nr:MAG: hypothetical protein DWH91_10310 [Planctomycetota bacterium]
MRFFILLSTTGLILTMGVWMAVGQESGRRESSLSQKKLPEFFQKLGLDEKQQAKLAQIHEEHALYLRNQLAIVEQHKQLRNAALMDVLSEEQKQRLREHAPQDYLETIERDPAGPPNPRLREFEKAIRKLVLEHYPEAIIKLEGNTISVEWNTMPFMIHTRMFNAKWWQRPGVEIGPQGAGFRNRMQSGIVGEIEFCPGQYGGMAASQTFDKHYYKDQLMLPRSETLDAYLNVRLKFPDDAPKEFLDRFSDLMYRFDQHVPKE